MIIRYAIFLDLIQKVDIWAIGCVLYHLACLEPPFSGDNLISLGNNIVNKHPKNLPT